MAPDEEKDFSEKRIDSKLVYDGRLLKVHEDRVVLPDGKQATREYVRHPGAVMIIALLDDETLLLERQFRYPLGRHFYELPAGKLEKGEAPLATARRELVEECGYEAGRWRQLATLHPCIGYSDERIDLFLARDLVYVGHAPDDGEFLEVLPTKIAVALEWVRSGRITEVKAVTGILWAEKLLRGEW
ncbi:MAG: NUDIX domain-containing protein [Burkholderiales bacterium]